MFGKVDKRFDHSVITVNQPVKIMPLRRAVLPKGTYAIQGDIRSKLGSIRVRRLMQAGVFDVEFVKGSKSRQKVSARTQTEQATIAPTPSVPDAQTTPEKTLPGVESQLGRTKKEEVTTKKEAPKPKEPEKATIEEPEAIYPDITVESSEYASMEQGKAPAAEKELTLDEQLAAEMTPATVETRLSALERNSIEEPETEDISANLGSLVDEDEGEQVVDLGNLGDGDELEETIEADLGDLGALEPSSTEPKEEKEEVSDEKPRRRKRVRVRADLK